MPHSKYYAILNMVQKGGGGGRVKPMFKKNCRIRNSLKSALVKAKNCLPNVQKEGGVVKGVLNNVKKTG